VGVGNGSLEMDDADIPAYTGGPKGNIKVLRIFGSATKYE